MPFSQLAFLKSTDCLLLSPFNNLYTMDFPPIHGLHSKVILPEEK